MYDLGSKPLCISIWMSLFFITSLCGEEGMAFDHDAIDSIQLEEASSLSEAAVPISDEQGLQIADSCADEQPSTDQLETPPSSPAQEMIGYNSAVRPFAQHGANLSIRGDALFWRASEDNLFYAYQGNDLNGSRIRNIKTVDFDWDWGFRVALGYTIPRDRWDLALSWTHFETKVTSHVSAHAPDKGLFINWWLRDELNLLGLGQSASGSWNPRLDQLDLSLGREFYVGRQLTLRPFAGVRTAWLDQQFNTRSNTTTGDAVTKMKNDFWGFGFSGGLDTKWMLASDWHLFANGTASILYGSFDLFQKATFNRELIFDHKKSFHSGKGILDIQAGLEWAHLFCQERFGVTIRAGYEYHLYADQSQFFLPTGNSGFPNSYTPVGGDLAFQGLFLSGQVDF